MLSVLVLFTLSGAMPLQRCLRKLCAVLATGLILMTSPAMAIDLFARHEVTVQFALPNGKPLADAEVRVFAPGQPGQPAITGHTDAQGKFEFPADIDGFWSAEARSGGEIDRVMVRVGGSAQPAGQELSPYWLLGGLFLLLVLAFAFRIARARLRQPRR